MLAENKINPVLRFKNDGRDYPDWEYYRLDEISKIQRGKFSPRPRNNPVYYGGDIPFVQTGDVLHSKGIIDSYTQTLNKKGLKVSKKFKKGTVLITIAANIGYSGVLEMDTACPDSLIGINANKLINNYFLNYLLIIEQPKMNYLADETAQKNINLEFLKSYLFSIPLVPEQQKIANFLSSVDTKIEQLSKKQNLLADYKKGMMQKLFSQTIRFKADDGSNYPDWEKKQLGEINTLMQSGLSRSLQEKDTGLPVIRSNNIQNSLLNINDIKYWYLDDPQGVKTSDYFLQDNDLLINFINSLSQIGKVALYENILNRDAICTTNIMRLKFSKKVIASYIYYSLKTGHFKSYLKAIVKPAVNQASFTSKDLKAYQLSLPCKEEQKKIANFLSSIDKKIEQTNNQITQTKQFKKALLQQMFV
jgi:type I restriction enzyme S subunit